MIDAVAGAITRPIPSGERHLAGQDDAVARVGRRRDAQELRDRDDEQARRRSGAAARSGRRRGVRLATTMSTAANGTVRSPAASGAVAEQHLQVLGQQEDRAEQAEVDGGHGDARAGEAGVAEHAEVEHRLGGARLVRGRSSAMHHDPHRDGAERARRGPPSLPPRITPYTSAIRPTIDSAPPPRSRRRCTGSRDSGTHERDAREREHDHRDVHEEDRAPVEVLEQHAAGERAEGDADARGAGPDRDRPLALDRLGEHVRDDRQRRREDERARPRP